jgi:hypothetical protein
MHNLMDFRAILLEHYGNRYLMRDGQWIPLWQTVEQDILVAIVGCMELGIEPTEDEIREGSGLPAHEILESVASSRLIFRFKNGWYPTKRGLTEFNL